MSIRKTPTVLLVEDDVENRAVMMKILDGAGFKTLQSDNGQEALDRILEGGIDLAAGC